MSGATNLSFANLHDVELCTHAATGERRHLFPSGKRFGIISECRLDERWQIALGFHRFEQLFGHLFGPALTRSRALAVRNFVSDPAADGRDD